MTWLVVQCGIVQRASGSESLSGEGDAWQMVDPGGGKARGGFLVILPRIRLTAPLSPDPRPRDLTLPRTCTTARRLMLLDSNVPQTRVTGDIKMNTDNTNVIAGPTVSLTMSLWVPIARALWLIKKSRSCFIH